MNGGHAQPFAGLEALDHDATAESAAANCWSVGRSIIAGDIDLPFGCTGCATAKIDHVYCWKSTSRKSATAPEIGRSAPMILN
jgi:hypothetical protein